MHQQTLIASRTEDVRCIMQQIMLRRHMGHNCCCSSAYTCRNTIDDEDEALTALFEAEEETTGSGHPHSQAIGILDEVSRHRRRRSLRNRPLTARARLTTTSKTTRPRPLPVEPSESSRAAAAARRTYADPEMKKRQQQEIVVSGLNINTSDISSSEEEEEESEVIDEQLQLFQDETLVSLVEPTVRKVGGGGAVSLSAFQVSLLLFTLMFLMLSS